MSHTKKNLRITTKNIIILSFIVLLALLTIANFTIFNSKVSIVNTSRASNSFKSDINNDQIVDITDLSMLLSDWGSDSAQSDIDSSGFVDIIDLSILLSNWGNISEVVDEKLIFFDDFNDNQINTSVWSLYNEKTNQWGEFDNTLVKTEDGKLKLYVEKKEDNTYRVSGVGL